MLTCAQPLDELALADGTRAFIRPLGPADRRGFVRLFHRLSPQSRHRRYLSPKPRLETRELAFLVDVDHRQHEALTAVDQDDGSLVGVARYVVYSDTPAVADAAVEVADDRHRLGIGRELMARVIMRARENGIEVLTATVLWENRPARALLRQLGFRASGSSGGEIQLRLDLRPVHRAVPGTVDAVDQRTS